MRKLTMYRMGMRIGRTIWLVTLTGFMPICSAVSNQPPHFYHFDATTVSEYYQLPELPKEVAATETEMIPLPKKNNEKIIQPKKKKIFSKLDPSKGPLKVATVETFPLNQETYVINFNNVNITEYIRFISKIAGTNFLFDQADLQFSVTIISEEPARIEDIMAMLIQVLRIHGLALAEQGNNLLIYKTADIAKIATVVTEGQDQKNLSLVTRVIRLDYITPDRAKAIIQPLLSGQALIEISTETRHLIITDITANIDKVLALLHSIDTPNSTIEVGTYTADYILVSNLINFAQKILAPIAISEGSNITLVPQPSTNTIFIVGTPDLISRALSILQTLDKPGGVESSQTLRSAAIEISSYTTVNLTPPVIIPLAEKILDPIAKADGTLLSLVQQPSTNTIFIVSTPELIQRALVVLRSLDTHVAGPVPPPDIPSTEMEGSILYIYKLQYLKGDKIQDAMQEIGNSLSKAGLSNADLINTINSMQWVDTNNSIIFVGTPASIEKVKRFLRSLDKPPRQVYLEVLVLQTKLANSLGFGVEWLADGIHDTSLFLNTGVVDGVGAGGVPAGTFPANFQFPLPVAWPGVTTTQPAIPLNTGFNLGVIGNIIRHNGNVFASLGALVNAVQIESQSKILLNPKIMTEDNNTAQVFVGSNIPFTTANVQIQAANGSTGFNIDYRDVGVLLEVTPILGNSDIITLDLHQEITQVVSTTSVATTFNGSFPIPTTSKALTTTRVHIPSNYFMVLSGMISREKDYSRSGIPCLGCLPIIGAAFSSQAESYTANNVLIFIHPRIIDTRDDIARITDIEGCDFECNSRGFYPGHKLPNGCYTGESARNFSCSVCD